MKGLFASLILLTATACERAGADFKNVASRPVRIASVLAPEKAEGARLEFVVKPGEEVQSVWYVNDHRSLRFSYQKGPTFSFDGQSLTKLAKQCPDHCILLVSESGVRPVMTGFFGKPLN